MSRGHGAGDNRFVCTVQLFGSPARYDVTMTVENEKLTIPVLDLQSWSAHFTGAVEE